MSTDAKQIQPGAGTLLSNGAMGFSLTNPNAWMSFAHPFQPVLVGEQSGAGLRFRRGVVEGFEPEIKGVPMSGDVGRFPPVLALNYQDANQETNESWAVLRVVPNDTGTLDKDSAITIVHQKSPGGAASENFGSTALALILWRNRKPMKVWPIVFFNLRYKRKVVASGPTQHFFL